MGTIANSPVCVGGLGMRFLLVPGEDTEHPSEFGAPIYTSRAEFESAGLDMQYEVARVEFDDVLSSATIRLREPRWLRSEMMPQSEASCSIESPRTSAILAIDSK